MHSHLAGQTHVKIPSAPPCLSAAGRLASTSAKFSSALLDLESYLKEKPVNAIHYCRKLAI